MVVLLWSGLDEWRPTTVSKVSPVFANQISNESYQKFTTLSSNISFTHRPRYKGLPYASTLSYYHHNIFSVKSQLAAP